MKSSQTGVAPSAAPVSLFDAARLDGKVAVVTGAASGIGLAVARHLARAGAELLLIDSNARNLATSTRDLGARSMVLDLSQWDELEALEAALSESAPDILVNSAGIFPTVAATELTEADWDRVLDLNLKGAVRVSQIAARAMIAAGKGGAIVNIGSVQALRPGVGKIAYASSKAGLAAATQILARELAPHGIRANVVAPGPVLTGATRAAIGSDVLPPGVASADMIARVVHFLASPAAEFVNGAVWLADGGAALHR